jgi:SAM-dependent methyltransferase
MTDAAGPGPPSEFIVRSSALLAQLLGHGARALDVAAGRGRHSLTLAAAGFLVTSIDIRLDALAELMAGGRRAGVRVSAVCADLESLPLPASRFEVVVVSRYLDRARMPVLIDALAPRGVMVYETFTERQLQHGRGPRSRAHLLAPGELRTLMRGFEVLFDEEVTEPDALARIVARKPAAPLDSAV